MPPPPVAMAASKLRIKTLEEQLKQKDKIIHELKVANAVNLALAAEEARNKNLAKMNKGWRKHNANPYTPQCYRKLVLHPPKKHTRLRLSQPKQETSLSMQEVQFTRWRLSHPKAERVEEDSHKVRSGRVLKASAKARK